MGLRLGEALAMQLDNIDWDQRTYRVTSSYRQKVFRRPKRRKGRCVDVPEYLIIELKDYVDELHRESIKNGKNGHVDLLFEDPESPTKRGFWPISQRKAQMLVKKVCKGANLRIRSPHALRHTYATTLLMAHQSPGYVKRQLGHSNISTTMDIYLTWIPGEGREGLERALLGKKADDPSKSPNH
jgi:integrase